MVSSAQNSSLAAVHFFERIFCKSSFCHQYFHKYHFYRFIKLLYDHKEATLAAKSETQKRSVELKYINVLCGNHGKHNKSMVPCVSQIMGKNKTFPLNQKLTCANHGIYVATCATNNISGKPRTNFPRDGHHTAVIRTDPIAKLMKIKKTKRPCRGTFQIPMANVNKPPIREAYIVTFVEEPNSLSLDFCEDKWYHKLNAQITIQNTILPRVR